MQQQIQQHRIHNLDALRGVAVLGILIMNGVAYGLGTTAYFNFSFDTDPGSLDRVIAIAGEIIANKKFMALFSILFGAGIVLFHERLAARHGSTQAVFISLWRNALLLLMGLIHSYFWDGDILVVYAMAAPLLLMARNLPTRLLLAAGTAVVLLSLLSTLVVQLLINAQEYPLVVVLGDYWAIPDRPAADIIGLWLVADVIMRALGMMLLGIGLYKTGYLSGTVSTRIYCIAAIAGTTIGWMLSAGGVLWVSAKGYTGEVALIGAIPNSLGALPAVLGYIAIITLCVRYLPDGWRHRLYALGRMALTNYLTQTLLGLLVFTHLLNTEDITRTTVVLFVLFIWALQLWWSSLWLARYTQGPMEWLWRCATHRRALPLLRHPSPSEVAE